MEPTELQMSQAGGIVRDNRGFAFVPATQRPDGTWRKARRVKEGYVPQEDVERYKNKGVRMREAAPKCPGLSYAPPPSLKPVVQETSTSEVNLSKSARKNQRRKELRQKKKDETFKHELLRQYETAIPGSENDMKSATEQINERLAAVDISQGTYNQHTAAADNEKKIKNIRKKLRQIEDLKGKIYSGQIPVPDDLQLDKIKKKDGLLAELKELERNK